MANRIGNKIWKEKSRRGMSRKRFWTKKLFYKAGKRNICRRNRIALHVQHARITALVFYNTFILIEQRNIYAIFQINLQEEVLPHDQCFWMFLSICPYLMAGGVILLWGGLFLPIDTYWYLQLLLGINRWLNLYHTSWPN